MQTEDCAVSSSHPDHASTTNTTVLVEPDDVPTGMLTKLAIAVTITIVVSVLFVVSMFDRTLAAELEAKGYTDAAVPSENSGAKTW